MSTERYWSMFLERIDRGFAREHLVLGTKREGSPRLLASQSTRPEVIHNIGVALGISLEVERVDDDELAAMIDDAYGNTHELGSLDLESNTENAIDIRIAQTESDLLSTSGKNDTARFLDAVIFDAIRANASDVHIHPLEHDALIRYRIDGVLSDARTIPRSSSDAVVSRLKVLGSMDTAETRSPQDGRATMKLGRGDSRSVDMRISTIPTAQGERAVIRILDTNRGRMLSDLDSIGMPEHIRSVYDRITARPNGMVLLTGPTGSGKTTTLYATLRRIAQINQDGGSRSAGLNIMTVEDPIEYRLSDTGITISQSQVNRKKGMSFASGLRHILRQDPDVVMVGEIRDEETASLAIQAALTGHLVFSTLHTNDAVGAPPRLIDLGCEPYLVSAALTAAMAQRLVRVLHSDCKGEGCESCLGTGFRGRAALFELFALDEAAREMVSQGSSAIALRRHSIARGMRTLRENGMALVSSGITTRAEIERVTVDLSELPLEHPHLPQSGASA